MAHDCTTLTRFDRYLPQLFLLLLQIIRLLPWSSRGCPPWITTSSCRTDNQNRLHLVSQKNKKKILYLFQGSHTLRRAILRSCRQGNVRNSICKYSCVCTHTQMHSNRNRLLLSFHNEVQLLFSVSDAESENSFRTLPASEICSKYLSCSERERLCTREKETENWDQVQECDRKWVIGIMRERETLLIFPRLEQASSPARTPVFAYVFLLHYRNLPARDIFEYSFPTLCFFKLQHLQ